jgi:hypothetical protein
LFTSVEACTRPNANPSPPSWMMSQIANCIAAPNWPDVAFTFGAVKSAYIDVNSHAARCTTGVSGCASVVSFTLPM